MSETLFDIPTYYIPNAPYVFEKGRYAGKTAEWLMFKNYPYLLLLLNKADHGLRRNGSRLNRMHRHLRWLKPQGENRVARRNCLCGDPLTQASIYGSSQFGYSMGVRYCCCDKDECRQRILAMAGGNYPLFLRLKFSSITILDHHRSDQQQFADLLQQVFLPGVKRLTPEILFEFFRT